MANPPIMNQKIPSQCKTPSLRFILPATSKLITTRTRGSPNARYIGWTLFRKS